MNIFIIVKLKSWIGPKNNMRQQEVFVCLTIHSYSPFIALEVVDMS